MPGTEPEKKDNATEIKPKPIGVIIPPSDIRKIADKTAEFVVKNGSSFEELVMKSEANNPKFSFLKPNDPYRAYYDQRVIDFARGTAADTSAKEQTTQDAVAVPGQKKDSKKEVKKDLKAPPPEQFTVTAPANLSPQDIDIIKLTAQFVAKNGQKFLISLTEKEKNNPQFDFLKPTHQLFSFFTSLVDAYSKCIAPKKDDIKRLQTNISDKMSILNRCGERFEYEHMQRQMKKKQDELEEEERQQMAQIDWNDFVVVETIDLFGDEELPAPANFQQQEQPVVEPTVEPNILPPAQEVPKKPVVTEPVDLKVKKDYVPKANVKDQPTNKCPVCGQFIPISEFNEHMRIELLDPKYRTIQDEVKLRGTNVTMASGEEVAQNLAQFAKRRPDLFGSVEDQLAREAQARKEEAKILYDGVSTTMTRTTANIAMLAQQQKKALEEQMRIGDITKVSTTVTSGTGQKAGAAGTIGPHPQIQTQQVISSQPQLNPSYVSSSNPEEFKAQMRNINMGLGMGVGMPMGMPMGMPGGLPSVGSYTDGMEPTKKLKNEETMNLIGEEAWLSLHPGPVTVNVKVDLGDEEETDGKVITLQLDPTTTVNTLKEKLSGQLGGLAAAKMKLKTPTQNVLKDENSLAYYNVLNGASLELGLKERGGRRK